MFPKKTFSINFGIYLICAKYSMTTMMTLNQVQWLVKIDKRPGYDIHNIFFRFHRQHANIVYLTATGSSISILFLRKHSKNALRKTLELVHFVLRVFC